MVWHIIRFRSQMDSSFLTEPHCMYVELKIVSTKMRRLIVSFAINFWSAPHQITLFFV